MAPQRRCGCPTRAVAVLSCARRWRLSPRYLIPLVRTPLVLLAACSDYDYQRISLEDTFVQEGGNLTVDVLWVMDNSGTMSEEQANVVANLSSFVAVLDDFGADWQLGVITTAVDDPETAGVLVSTLLTPYVEGVAERFASDVAVGVNGSIDEQGLEAIRLSTSEPLLSGANAGLVRSAADLAIIVLSDEDDHSADTVDAYEGHLATLKGEGGARLSAVVGQLPSGCASPYAAADAAERYLAVSTWSGGLQDSICRQDFSETMQQLALNALGLQASFTLSQVPEPGSVEVRLNDVLLYERAENGWQYDAGQNAITLDGYAVPGPGMGLSIQYFEWSGNSLAADTAGQVAE